MPNQTMVTPTYSVRNTISKLSGKTEPSSWDVVHALLENHKEYAGNRGELLLTQKPPAEVEHRPDAASWLDEVSALFDPELVHELHGRLLVLGLCRLDPVLGKFLREREFLRPLSDELEEDFESLLLPEHAGEQAYRREFLKLLQNKPVDGTKPRARGFCVMVEGGPGLPW